MSIEHLDKQLRAGSVRTPSLSLELSSRGSEVVITISGELDMETAHLLPELVDRVGRDHAGPVVLDMAGVTFLCAAGIRALLVARDMITAAGGRLTLRDPSPPTRWVLAITGDEHLLSLSPAPTQPDDAISAKRPDRIRSTVALLLRRFDGLRRSFG